MNMRHTPGTRRKNSEKGKNRDSYGAVRLKSKGVWEIFNEKWKVTGTSFRCHLIKTRLCREIIRHIKSGICVPTPHMDAIERIATLLEDYKECSHLLTYKACVKLIHDLNRQK